MYATSLYPEGLTCLNIIEATDRVQVALQISNTVNEIWLNSKCDGTVKSNLKSLSNFKEIELLNFVSILDCFESYEFFNDTANFTLKPNIEKFFEYQEKLELCISNFTKVSLKYKYTLFFFII